MLSPMAQDLSRGARLAAGGLGAVLAVSLAACGSSEATTAGGGSVDADCMAVPTIAPKDPQGVVAQLPDDVAAGYNGYPVEVLPSAWSDWKPSHPGPYRVGVIWQPPVNPTIVQMHDHMITELQASGEVEIIADVAPQSPTDVPGALQLFDQLVAKKPDLIILSPIASEPFAAKVDAAGAAGLPVVTPFLPVESEYAIGPTYNNWLTGAQLASSVAEEIGGEGNVLVVRGIPGVQSDTDMNAGFTAVIEQCSGLELAGEVVGNYNVAEAKSAVLQFLSTHPEPIDAVLQIGVMTPGVIQAFEQLGRPVPVIADSGATHASVGYAHDHADSYVEIGSSNSRPGQGRAFAETVLRTLRGEGPVVNHMVVPATMIEQSDVDDIYEDGWTLGDLNDATHPDDVFMTDAQLGAFFGE
jgi:ribose transport system substrate-binding protein